MPFIVPGLASTLPIAETFAAEYLEYYRFLPLELDGGVLRVAVAGEQNADALRDLEQSYGATLELIEAPLDDLLASIRHTFSAAASVVELVRDLDASGTLADGVDPADLADVRDLANQPPVVKLVHLLLRDAYDAGASDLHLEATREGLRARLRLDGVLSELPSPPSSLAAGVISKLKLMAELDIAERRAPQDGRIRIAVDGRELDIRVSTVPTLFGESVVLRFLDRGGRPVDLAELGMDPATLVRFERLARRPHGIILATGPTGSGKTTTLYAALALRDPGREKLITVEDPVEYHLSGVTQVPVQSKAGVTFAAALRSILRQDPDVLMVGEMRDGETASIAVQSAMTGHLVFSTLHTNDALSALHRLADLKVEPYLVAATVEGILAQRLVRRVCPECRTTYHPEPSSVAILAGGPVGKVALTRGAGCSACRGTGFKGRLGLFELLVMSDELRDSLLQGAPLARMRALAREQGMVTLREDGWTKVQAGLTTVEEVLRVAE
jgi:general secretion pathway protein E